MNEPAPRKPLRLWPGVAAVVLQWLAWFVIPVAIPEAGMIGAVGGLAGGLAVVAWWVLFSRAAWSERVGAIVVMIVALLGTTRVVHPSIANGMMGMMLVIYSVPILSLALVVWAAGTNRLSNGVRRASMVAAILVACGVFTLLRTGGVAGDGTSDITWRWTPSSEEQLLSRAADAPMAAPATPAATKPPGQTVVPQAGREPLPRQPTPSPASAPQERVGPQTGEAPAVPAAATGSAEWPGFRGPERDGVVHDVRIETDWAASPPVRMWRRPIGPGWSSFAVRGDRFYTQEQRGTDEIVSCYSVTTGEPLWRHRDAARFWESNAGAGPRGTPTLADGRVFTFGATGILNALDAGNGAVAWSRNVASDTGTNVPTWGFSSSPLVVDDVVVVAAAGRLAAYDTATGNQRWSGPDRGGSYSSPHRATIGGIPQILLLNDAGVTSVAPADGIVLWEHPWRGAAIVQPALIADGEFVVGTASAAGGIGVRRIAVNHGTGGWTVEERWTSTGLKPYFNDFVVHKGHAFGFDGSILACIDLEDGKRTWKGGRYGNGQLMLLSDQDLLLVLSEEGELALVGATPDQFRELARVPGVKGKTWNHPALAGNVLLIRNGEEMAAFRLRPGSVEPAPAPTSSNAPVLLVRHGAR